MSEIDAGGFYTCDLCGSQVPENAACTNPPCMRLINRLVQETQRRIVQGYDEPKLPRQRVSVYFDLRD